MEYNSMKALTVGDTIPEFSFEVYHNKEDKQMSTKEFAGKWLIFFFYPADFTFVCPTELQDMAEHYDKFKAGGAEIISVSTDKVHTHKAWHDTSPAIGMITFPMAADPTHTLAKAFGVLLEDKGLTNRGSFIVDPNGVIQVVEITADGIGRNASELLRKFEAAKFVHEHGDKVCPANWKPGGDTLKPGMDLVGKI
jgi:peroxiredoxin